MKKLLAVVWLAVWTVLPMSVALGTDTKAKGDELMTAKGVVVAARSWNISADPAVRHAQDFTPPRGPSIVYHPKTHNLKPGAGHDQCLEESQMNQNWLRTAILGRAMVVLG